MKQNNRGFTLIEVMLVILVVGFLLNTIVINMTSSPVEEKLEAHSHKFAALFNLASEYSLLNNVELGLLVEDNSYQFLGFDGVRWLPIPSKDSFTQQQFEPPFAITLRLDELELDGQMIIDQSMFEDMLEDEDGFEEEDEPVYPQVFILSGGDITPFNLTFTYDDDFDLPIYYEVTGIYTIPLKVEGPFTDERN